MTTEQVLLSVDHLSIHYARRGNWPFTAPTLLRAVDDISFGVSRGETFGLVGESGCGKSSIGRTILRLQQPTAGHVIFDGVDITRLPGEELRQFRRRMQMVFQDSYSSLNPYMTVADIIREPLEIFAVGTKAWRCRRVGELLEAVGLPLDVSGRYPHEFSGGQRQRINIARALALEPDLIVCDEPVSALDVSIQAQITDLLAELQGRLGLTYIFISHDLAVVRDVCHRIAVMYLGKICEITRSDDLYGSPLHPYTKALLSAIPIPDPIIEAQREAERITLSGEVPDAAHPPAGCRFFGRCPMAERVRRDYGIDCGSTPPTLAEARPGHRVACHLYPVSRPH